MRRMSYVSSHIHCVFSTKERRPMIAPELRERLWPFMGGIARQNQMKAIEIRGVPDHVTSCCPCPRQSRLQRRCGAFGVSVSQLDKIIQYIRNQEEHHRKMTFQEEFLALLKKHRIDYDERYLWE